MEKKRIVRFLSLLAVLCIAPLTFFSLHSSQAQGDGVTDPMKQFTIGNLDGLSGRIAFTATIGSVHKIMALDLDAQKVRMIIDGPGDNFYPSWSPDGKKIAFTSDRDGNREIYVADYDGSSLIRLTNNKVIDDNPSWSPDGKDVLYYSVTAADGSTEPTNLFTIPATGGTPQQLTHFTSGKNSTPRWSPDGKYIAYSTNRHWPGWDICLWNVHSNEERCILGGTKTYCRPMWSANGQLIAFSSGLVNNINVGFYNLKTRTRKMVTSLAGKEYDAVWSPSGREIAFASQNAQSRSYDIWIDRQFKSTALLSSPHSLRYLSWSPIKTIDLEAERIRSGEEHSENEPPEDFIHPLLMEEYQE